VRRWAPILISIAVLAAVLWPALSPDHDDGFPVSNYPMFATARPRVNRFHTAVGVDRDGHQVILDPRTIGGSTEAVHATETVRFAIADATTDELCVEITRRLGARRAEIAAVEVRTDTYDAVAWFEGDEDPVASVVHSRCPT
jgi:hypothetical protein